MEILATLDDYSLGLSEAPVQTQDGWVVREAARAIIFNQDGDVALLHAKNFGYHKLPGGGLKRGSHGRMQYYVRRLRRQDIK